MISLDEKQQRLVTAWIGYGTLRTGVDRDEYSRFISLWVAFNAVCYARYATVANKYRPDLAKDHGLTEATSDPKKLEGTISRKSDRVKLEIARPGRIIISIAKKYTEDVIYAQFAKEFQRQYTNWLTKHTFESEVLAFREAIKKDKHYYVINMARASELKQNSNYKEMRSSNIIVSFENHKMLKQLKDVMYQVRNNVFHGEKVPGDLNDDWIVKAAHPVLLNILKRIVPECVG